MTSNSNSNRIRGPLTASSRALEHISEQVQGARKELERLLFKEVNSEARCEQYIDVLRSRHLWDDMAKWDSARHYHRNRADGLRLALAVLDTQIDV